MRKPFIAGNWKMHKNIQEATSYGELLLHKIREAGVDSDKVEIGLFVPYIHLSALSIIFDLSGVGVGAQNMFYEDKGAYTGEISPSMLSDLGIRHTIIGHSERRQYFGETDEACARKIRAAYAHDIEPVLCVGEDLEDREAGKYEDTVRTMLLGSLKDVAPEETEHLTVAYEPVWAIGTGKTATTEQAQEMAAFIRTVLADRYGSDRADQIRIQYGGSVKPENIAELMSMPDIDGALVGGSSLDAEKFMKIIAYDDALLGKESKRVRMIPSSARS